MPQVLGSTDSVHSPLWSLLVDNRVGKSESEGEEVGGDGWLGVLRWEKGRTGLLCLRNPLTTYAYQRFGLEVGWPDDERMV